MKEMDYISQMVLETLQPTHHEETDRYQQIAVVHGFEDRDRKCIVLLNKMGYELEVPINWGPFKDFIGKELIIEKDQDPHSFLSVISSFFNEDFQAVRIDLDSIDRKQVQRRAA